MQTFVPESTFKDCAKALDYRRLGNQRNEATVIYNLLTKRATGKGWLNHTATRMWAGYENALAAYYNAILDEWERRGYRNNLPYLVVPENITLPPWWNNADMHRSHQSNLIKKNPEHYRPLWPDVPDTLPYVWPEGDMKVYQELVEYYKEMFE